MGVAAVYLRLSQEDKASGDKESGSISGQRLFIRNFIEQDSELKKYSLIEFCDDGYSGTGMDRPGMNSLLEEVRKGRVTCIIVKDLSRFSRDYIELGTYLNQVFPFMGVRFISVADRYDSRNHDGNTIELDTAFKTLLNDLYSKDISVKVKTSLGNKYAEGEYAFGQCPFGYEKDSREKNRVKIHEGEAAVVRYIFSLACQGKSSTEIARILHEKQIPTASWFRRTKVPDGRRKSTWDSTKVRNILKNRFYLGEMSYGKSRRISVGSSRGRKVPEKDWKVIRGHHEPLVTEKEFEQASCAKPASGNQRKLKKHPLVGKLVCGGCGYAMVYKPFRPGNRYPRFECSRHAILKMPECCNYFRSDMLEEMVLSMLSQELLMRGEAAEQKESLELFQKTRTNVLQNRLQELYRKKETDAELYAGLYESYADGKMTAEEYRKAADEAKEKAILLDRQIHALQEQAGQAAEEQEKLKADMKQVIRYSHLEELTQEIADVFIEKIYVCKDKRVEIKWKFTDSV
jgi:Site-specific recombinases, DNA invertase Pin homologs